MPMEYMNDEAGRRAQNGGPDLAFIGRKPCGCVCAVCLDCDPKSKSEYLRRGYLVETIWAEEAIRLVREYRCNHE